MNNFKVERQHDCMQCGIACLQMICNYYGKEYSLDSLSKICFATTEGVSMLGISETATSLGFHVVNVKCTVKNFNRGFSTKYPSLESKSFCSLI